jgi:hypothetical protein
MEIKGTAMKIRQQPHNIRHNQQKKKIFDPVGGEKSTQYGHIKRVGHFEHGESKLEF